MVHAEIHAGIFWVSILSMQRHADNLNGCAENCDEQVVAGKKKRQENNCGDDDEVEIVPYNGTNIH